MRENVALKQVFRLYAPSGNQPLFQCLTHHGYQVATDSIVRKTLASINLALHLPTNFIPSMLSGVQVPPWHTRPMHP